jgi:RsiW-degrading membrane proteinase PrsW (M82 family)
MTPMMSYILSLVAVLITAGVMYAISNDTEKNEPKKILIRNVLPGIVVGLMVFVIIKYRDNKLAETPEVMTGNYFD